MTDGRLPLWVNLTVTFLVLVVIALVTVTGSDAREWDMALHRFWSDLKDGTASRQVLYEEPVSPAVKLPGVSEPMTYPTQLPARPESVPVTTDISQ
jgi:hypothetical protein